VLHEAVGCPACDFRGYRGRLAITEILPFDAELDELVARRAHTAALRATARRKGFRSLAEDGVRRVLDGSTSLRELARVVDLSTLVPADSAVTGQ
jgi:general secretion pathway protein E/type IV pilus assembly protein PilB